MKNLINRILLTIAGITCISLTFEIPRLWIFIFFISSFVILIPFFIIELNRYEENWIVNYGDEKSIKMDYYSAKLLATINNSTVEKVLK